MAIDAADYFGPRASRDQRPAPQLWTLGFQFWLLQKRYESMEIKRKYVVDDKNRKVAVQLDIGTFEKIEEVLENYGLVQLMSDEEENEALDINKAKDFYKNLEKAE